MTGRASDEHAIRRASVLLSMGVAFAMLGGKWAAYWLTGSLAILSDAQESFVNILATGFAFAGLLLSARPPDPKYPYGYGRIAYFSAGFEGGMINLAALAIVYQAVLAFIRGEPLRRLDLGLAIILASSLVNLALGRLLIRQGQRTRSLILEADGRHVLADAYTSFGVVAGVALVRLTGRAWLDPAVALLVGLNLLRTGFALVRESVTGLMARADPELLGRIVAALDSARQPGWIDVHHLRAWRAGDRTFVDFHLVVPEPWTVGQLHIASDRALDALRAALGPEAEAIIHFDPDQPDRPHPTRPGAAWTVAGAVRVPAPDDLGGEPLAAPVEGIRA